jgi:hypothetical protein
MTTTGSRRNLLPPLLGDFQTLLLLHVTFRLLLIIAYQPLLLEGGERGVTTGGDYLYYYALSAQVDEGRLPFRDWWSEFPPLWSVVEIGVYKVLGDSVSYSSYATLLAVVMLAFDAGNLVLLRQIGRRLYGDAVALSLAWIYALLLAPMVFAFWTFEPMVMFSILASIRLLQRGRDRASAVVVGLGALTKFVPVLVIGAVVRFRPARRAAVYIALVVGVFALPYALLLANPATRAMTAPSLTAQFNKASYQTVWALLDGNYGTGVFGPVEDRADPANAKLPRGNPSTVPGWVRLGLGAAVGLFVLVRTRRIDDRGMVAFVLVTLVVFYLQSQGWSPQWLVEILPLTLLCFPSRNGVLFAVMLSTLTFAEYPALFIRTGDTGGLVAGPLVLPFVLLVVMRTVLLAALGVAGYRVLRQRPAV